MRISTICFVLVAASAVVLAAFAAFSYYINSVQRGVTTAAIEANIQSSGEQAAHSLGMLRDARATDALIALLKDPNADVRQQAVFALGQIR